ncbi:MFS transporter [Ignatzschineria cameli]|uniref:MFS transporter n=1 Tax=Ignatzschineria cameli TaxID=2182793 RepID=A0A2U2ATE6_9GAMM|nr:MFS transporter [Ignatzschineria cameli]PWD87998.1 MFS transporter [Ignatzschineria cameli]PWD91030.1 MFS transporter [Ignatzschineria cameli]PWD92672.1 MFS transporter [Ignatzschineria cameli]PWD93692.1 MFS transporter [Ignatzschineria cameli]
MQTRSLQTAVPILLMLGSAHLLNDFIQSMLTAIYPMLQELFLLDFAKIGLISLIYQCTASILQPAIGFWTDKHPKPYLLPTGMVITTSGITLLAFATSYHHLLIAAAMMGVGSSIFHPEAVRLTRIASGGRFGLAQSIFQVGGNMGSAFGPLIAGIVIVKYANQNNILYFVIAGITAIVLLTYLGHWGGEYQRNQQKVSARKITFPYGKRRTIWALITLGVLIFAKYFYMANFTNYFSFYLIEKFDIERSNAVILLFLFLAAIAIGTFAGGPIGDRIGRRSVIWFSMLGTLPFTLILPHLPFIGVMICAVIIGLILASAFSAIVVFAQELVPGSVGMIAGIFFGLMFGMSGIGALFLGWLADVTSLQTVFVLTSFLPIIGVLTFLLPKEEEKALQ